MATPLRRPSSAVQKKIDAGLIVMGAYSHSRMREMIMGGVTAYMLKHADVPILMMH